MDDLTYQQVLADIYEETSKNALVHQTEYEEDEIPAIDKHEDELDNQEEFKTFGGSRQIVEVPKHLPKFDDKTTQSVRYNKDVQTRVISIDSRFRTDYNDASTNFLFKLVNPVKNVVSIRLSSIEIPNTYYNFSVPKGNTTFDIVYPSGSTNPDDVYTVDLIGDSATVFGGSSGINYYSSSSIDDFKSDLQAAINTALQGTPNPPTPIIKVDFDLKTSRFWLESSLGNEFDLDFGTGPYAYRQYDWGLGYNIGFRNKEYVGSFVYAAEAVADLIGPNYLFLSLYPDWKVVTHNHPDRTQFAPFAKIIVDAPKNDIIYDNGSNTVTKEYWLPQPITVSLFQVVLTDPYEEFIDLVGANVSLTVELKEIMNPSLYEHIRSI
jgi:hypothetical protein